jgi:hypothetical protein
LKKRTKKLLFIWLRVAAGTEPKKQKFFASFFQKRRPFLAFCNVSAPPGLLRRQGGSQ